MALQQTAVYPLTISGEHKGDVARFTNAYFTNVSGSSTVSGADVRGTTSTIPNISTTNLSGSGNVSGSVTYGSRVVVNTINTTIPSGAMKIGETIILTGAAVGSTGATLLYLMVPSGSRGAIYSFSGSYVSAASA